MGLYPQRYALYLLSSCPWLNTSGSGGTGSGSSGAYQWHSPFCHGRCTSGLCALFFWRNLCSPRSCIPRSVYLRRTKKLVILVSILLYKESKKTMFVNCQGKEAPQGPTQQLHNNHALSATLIAGFAGSIQNRTHYTNSLGKPTPKEAN